MVSTSSRHVIEGDNPPCIQKIDCEIRAAGGIQLKQLTKEFHNFKLNRDLPKYHNNSYINYRNHKLSSVVRIRGCLGEGRNC
jgi:hypothetical protein